MIVNTRTAAVAPADPSDRPLRPARRGGVVGSGGTGFGVRAPVQMPSRPPPLLVLPRPAAPLETEGGS